MKRKKSNAANQLAYRERHRAEYLADLLFKKVKQAEVVAAELGKLQGLTYVCSAVQVPPLLAQSILAREKSQGIPAADQVKTFFLAGAEVIHRALDLALAKGTVTPENQSELVDRLAGEVAQFAAEVEIKGGKGASH